eukprot:CAMPEP_0202962704 /NCGR_PEP_ID=MMETSP1396-20130829/6794_1 /ASSEMBLY_ACC=CAM_ASM_000872 /TAXON_ID= /ORGANISM="Pseudokeronopsis sp., Strain Brazil" /LENGTH=123 /DNA_ID=CAMNT_0049683453 /DNA_START=171 /DNA_END=542 /DNA_ORIENTATION=+
MADKLRVFSQQLKVPLYTFAEDLAASGGYWLLSEGDKVFANKSSLVGSIGVISATVNMRGLFDRTKIKRHSFLTSDKLLEWRFDPLRERKEGELMTKEEEEFFMKLMDEVQADFHGHVLRHRG